MKLKKSLAIAAMASLAAIPAATAVATAQTGSPAPKTATSQAASPSKAAKASEKTDDVDEGIVCDQVFHIGDSLSVGGKAAGLADAYADVVGAEDVEVLATGGQAIIEKTKGVSGADAIASLASRADDDTCWVIAFGTNDANNIAAGSGVGAEERIDKAIAATGGKGHIWWIGPAVDPDKTTFAEQAEEFTAAAKKAKRSGDLDGVIDFGKFLADDEWSGTGGDGIHLADYKEYVDFVTGSLELQMASADSPYDDGSF